MLNILHAYHPSPIIFQIGQIAFYWYGLFIVLGVAAGLFATLKLSKLYQIEKERIINLSFWLIIFGIIGARFFDFLFYNGNYFLKRPVDILKVWQGGMSIHGALISGLIFLFFYCRKNKNILPRKVAEGDSYGAFWFFADLFAPALILGQAIGRWGNYFNQELYGSPSAGIFSVPIDLINRVSGMENFSYFQPVFLYEFIGGLIIFFVLIRLHKKRLKSRNSLSGSSIKAKDDNSGVILNEVKNPEEVEMGSFGRSQRPQDDPPPIFTKKRWGIIFLTYLILYSALRFIIEFIRIDPQPVFFSLRLSQWISLLLIIFSLVIIIKEPLAFCLGKGHKA